MRPIFVGVNKMPIDESSNRGTWITINIGMIVSYEDYDYNYGNENMKYFRLYLLGQGYIILSEDDMYKINEAYNEHYPDEFNLLGC